MQKIRIHSNTDNSDIFLCSQENDLKKQIVSYSPNVFTKKECEEIIALGDTKYKNRWADARVYNIHSGNRTAPVEEDTRLGETNFFRYFEEPWIINKLLPVAREYNNRYCKWDIDWFGLDHEMQLARYSNTGDWFEWHSDIDWNITEHLESLHENKYKRKISVIIQLTDPKEYDGGRLLVGNELRCESDLDSEAEYLQQGTVIFFPSWYKHKVTQITRGTRYSFTIWLLGPPWK